MSSTTDAARTDPGLMRDSATSWRAPRSSLRTAIGLLAIIALSGALLAQAASAQGSTLIVNSTEQTPDVSPGDGACFTGTSNSAGADECTLAAAIQEVNAGSATAIEFNMPPGEAGHNNGVWTIQTTQGLDPLSSSAVIDGRTQPGWVLGGPPVILIEGSGNPNPFTLQIGPTASNSAIHGFLVVGNNSGPGIWVRGDGSEISNNYLGVTAFGAGRPNMNGVVVTDATGVVIRDNVASGNNISGVLLEGSGGSHIVENNNIGGQPDLNFSKGNRFDGVLIEGSPNNVVSGNVIGGNLRSGIHVIDAAGTEIFGNIVGTNPAGDLTFSNRGTGIFVTGLTDNTVIGAAGQPNTIAENRSNGIHLSGAGTANIQHNLIGLNAAGQTDLGNGATGIFIESQTADVRIADNTIHHNAHDGVAVTSDTTGVIGIAQNSFDNNGQQGIDLGADSFTVNDPGDADSGPNGLLNYPEILNVVSAGSGFLVQYELTAPAAEYLVRIYNNPSGNVDGNFFGEGEVLVGTQLVDHPGGAAQYTTTSPVTAATGDILTAHLAETGDGPASEFGNQATVPASTPAPPVVNSTRDLPDINPGDGLCWTGELNSVNDTECTLRAAIEEANAATGAETITFNIPQADAGFTSLPGAPDVWSIDVGATTGSALPLISDTLVIDGSSQPDWVDEPVISVDGQLLTGSSDRGFYFVAGAPDSAISDIAVTNFPLTGIEARADNVTITNNYVGILPDGSAGGNGGGITVADGASNVLVGGSPADGNIIGNNSPAGIWVNGNGTTGTVISYNTIGTSIDGSPAGNENGIRVLNDSSDTTIDNNTIENSSVDGIEVRDVENVTITNNLIADSQADNIGVDASSDVQIGLPNNANTIIGAGSAGIDIFNSGSGNNVDSNYIGQLPDGTPAGNSGDGVEITDSFRSTRVQDNAISNNGGDGLAIDRTLFRPTDVRISRNTFFNNAGLGIDLNDDGPTRNDPGDRDGFGEVNDNLNYPTIVDIVDVGGGLWDITFELDVDSGTYTLELFESSSPDNSGFGEAEVYLGSHTVVAGSNPTQVIIRESATAGAFFSSTLTNSSNLTSELSEAVVVAEINRPPVLSPIGPQSDSEGDTVSVFAVATDPDIPAENITYSTTSPLPPGLTLDPDTGEITGTLTFASAGSYPITIVATDDGTPNLTDTTTFTWTVTNTNQPPVLSPIGPQTDAEGDTVSVIAVATCLLYTSPSPRDS